MIAIWGGNAGNRGRTRSDSDHSASHETIHDPFPRGKSISRLCALGKALISGYCKRSEFASAKSVLKSSKCPNLALFLSEELLTSVKFSEAQDLLFSVTPLWKAYRSYEYSLCICWLFSAYDQRSMWQHSLELCLCAMEADNSIGLSPAGFSNILNRQLTVCGSSEQREILLTKLVRWVGQGNCLGTVMQRLTAVRESQDIGDSAVVVGCDGLDKGDLGGGEGRKGDWGAKANLLEVVLSADRVSEDQRRAAVRGLGYFYMTDNPEKAAEYWLEFVHLKGCLSYNETILVTKAMDFYMKGDRLDSGNDRLVENVHELYAKTGEFPDVIPIYFTNLQKSQKSPNQIFTDLLAAYKHTLSDADMSISEKLLWTSLPFWLKKVAPKDTIIEMISLLIQRYHNSTLIDHACATYTKSLSLIVSNPLNSATALALKSSFIDYCIITGRFDDGESILLADEAQSVASRKAKVEFYMKTWQVAKAESALIENIMLLTGNPTSDFPVDAYSQLIDFYTSIWEYRKAIDIHIEKASKLRAINPRSILYIQSKQEIISYSIAKYQYEVAETALIASESPLELSDFYVKSWEFSKAETTLQRYLSELSELTVVIPAMQSLAKVYQVWNKAELAKDTLLAAVDLALKSDFKSQLTATAVKSYCDFCESRNMIQEKAKVWERIVSLYKNESPTSEISLQIMKEIANLYAKIRKFDRAQGLLTEIIAIRKAQSPISEQTISELSALATLYSLEGGKNTDKEKEILLEIVRIREPENSFSQSVYDAKNRFHEFLSRFDVRKYEAAENVLKEMIEECKRKDPFSRETFAQMSKLDDLYRKTRQYAKSEPVLLEYLSLRKQQDPQSELTLQSLTHLSNYYLSQFVQQPSKAESVLTEIVAIRKLQNPYSESTQNAYSRLSEHYVKFGKSAEAESVLMELFELWKGKRPMCAIGISSVALIASFYRRKNEFQKLENTLVETLKMCEADNPMSEFTENALLSLANFYRIPEVKKFTEAEAAIQRAIDIRRRKDALSDATIDGLMLLFDLCTMSETGWMQKAEMILKTIVDIRKQKDQLSERTFDALTKLGKFYESNKAEIAKTEQVLIEIMQLRGKKDANSEAYRNSIFTLVTYYTSKNVSQPAKAESLLISEVEKYRKTAPFSDGHIAVVVRLSEYYLSVAKVEKGEEVLIATVDLMRKCQPFSNLTVKTMEKLVDFYTNQKSNAKIEAILIEILSIYQRQNPYPESLFAIVTRLGEFYCSLKEYGKAEAQYVAALSLRTRQDPYSSLTIQCRNKLVDFYIATGQVLTGENLLLSWLQACKWRRYEYQSALNIHQKLSEIYKTQGRVTMRIRSLMRYLALLDHKDASSRLTALKDLLSLYLTTSLYPASEAVLVRIHPTERRNTEIRSLYIA